MASLARYAHTLRHLRPVQLYGRLWHRAYRPRPDLRPAPPRRTPVTSWPGPLLRAPSLIGDARLTLLGDARHIATPADWQRVHAAALWLYNLHYFDDLNAPDPSRVRDAWQILLIDRWIAENPPAQGIGWDPYPTSLRIVSWIRWLLRGHDPRKGMLDSLAVQARWLRRRLEHHLLGNHLLVNCKALVVAGAFFAGSEAEEWRAEGHRLLARELAEQILSDGGHFERSPMYHALILEDVLDLIALETTFPGTSTLSTRLRDVAATMLGWLVVMTHPDGDIALFNDATLGVAASPVALAGYARTLGIAAPSLRGSVMDLAASGYTRVERAGAVLFTDTGEIGPGYTPAHGHADTLSFELSFQGRRILVDSGVSEYGTSAERVRQRGTAAHNTIVVDGEDSSEVWGGFRVARRAHVRGRRVDQTAQGVLVQAEHDGYHRLAGHVTHARTWRVEDGVVVIDDELRGHGRHRIDLVFHVAPGIRPELLAKGIWSLGPQIRLVTDPACAWRLLDGTVHPAMGSRVAASVLEGRLEAALPLRLRTQIRWTSGL